MPLRQLNASARALDPDSPQFPVNGSVSRVSSVFETLILDRIQEFFVPNDAQETDLFETRLAESIDEKLAKLDEPTLLAQAMAFDNSSADSHSTTTGSKRVRKESQLQKRRIAKLEDYTCQICEFQCPYENAKGKRAWIIHVDHIIEKCEGGAEGYKNLCVLCPNCHCKKTYGIIKIEEQGRKITYDGREIKLKRDNHLFL